MPFAVDPVTGRWVEDHDPLVKQAVTFTKDELNRTPFSVGIQQIEYMQHPDAKNDAKVLRVDKRTGMILKTSEGAPPTDYKVIPLPTELVRRPQPNVFSCSRPSADNLGCWACTGCTPFLKHELAGIPPPQPHNVIVHKDGVYDSARCYHTYAGAVNGRPTAQVQLLAQGWEIVTDRTSLREQARGEDGKKFWRDTEIPELGPEYDELKRMRAEEALKAEGAGEPVDVGDMTAVTNPAPAPVAPKAKRKYTRRKRVKRDGRLKHRPENQFVPEPPHAD